MEIACFTGVKHCDGISLMLSGIDQPKWHVLLSLSSNLHLLDCGKWVGSICIRNTPRNHTTIVITHFGFENRQKVNFLIPIIIQALIKIQHNVCIKNYSLIYAFQTKPLIDIMFNENEY
jgi:hypothetical protein